jgi:hypothetical protein
MRRASSTKQGRKNAGMIFGAKLDGLATRNMAGRRKRKEVSEGRTEKRNLSRKVSDLSRGCSRGSVC